MNFVDETVRGLVGELFGGDWVVCVLWCMDDVDAVEVVCSM